MTGPWLLLLCPGLTWLLPGWLFSRWLLPRADPLQRVATALVAGIVTVAPTTYLISVAGRVPESLTLILLVSALFVGLGVALLTLAPRRRDPAAFSLPAASSRLLLLLALAASAITTLATTPYAVETTEVWWHCPHLSALYLIEDGSGPGVRSYDPTWGREVTHLFQHPTEPGYGIGPVLGIQRAGNTAFLVQPLAFMSSSGSVAALFVTDFLVLAFAMLLLGRHLSARVLIAGLALLFHLGQRALAAYQVNENSLGLALGLAMLHLLLRDPRPVAPNRATPTPIPIAIAVGVVAAHLAGIRPATLMLTVGVGVLLRGGLRPKLAFAAALVAMGTPWMVAHAEALGAALIHPALANGRQAQTLFGLHFTFHPLNWPVTATLVTGPRHPFPMALRLPLEQLQAFGAPFLALAMAGLVSLRRDPRRLLGLLLVGLPIQLLLMAIVQLDFQKMSYVLLSLAPLPYLVGRGLGDLRLGAAGRGILAALCALGLVVLPKSLAHARFPVDHRGHGDFLLDPRDVVDEPQRRAALTDPSFGPYLSAELDFLNLGQAWPLLRHARPALMTERGPTDPLPEGLISVWAALPPSTLDYDVTVLTSEAPAVPPGFLGSGMDRAGNMSKGSALFLVELPAPAPRIARLRLARQGERLNLVVTTQGAETLPGSRWLSVLVVDRQHWFQPGRLSVLGQEETPFAVTLWRLLGQQWHAQPRLVTNAHYIYTEAGFRLSDHPALPIGEDQGFSLACGGDTARVYERGGGDARVRVLTNGIGVPQAIYAPGAAITEDRIMGFGRGYPAPRFDPGEACTRAFLGGRPLAGEARPEADAPSLDRLSP